MKFRIKLKKVVDNSYNIIIGSSLRPKLSDYRKCLVVTDSNLLDIAKEKFTSFDNVDIISFKAGEANKNLKTLAKLTEEALYLGLDRKSLIISFGGGVVGDVTGFLAGTYMRGVDYIHMPTTLLAMVDSSIGGKVGVDVARSKNISGLFYQPKEVYIDIEYLKSLPKIEIKNGLVEVIKYAIILDNKLFDYIVENLDKILQLDKQALIQIITRSCQIKSMIVQKDERESKLRMVLNHGHTIGHAIEALSRYKIPHGEAVAYGIKYECMIAHKIGMLSEKDLSKIISLIDMLEFSPRVNDAVKRLNTANDSYDAVINLIKRDKKSYGDKIRFVLPTRIGNVIIRDDITENIIAQVLKNKMSQVL